MQMRPPKVFISYKWQDLGRNTWVQRLYNDLRVQQGIDAQLDVYEVDFGESFSDYMTSRIDRDCDAMLFIITPAAVQSVDSSHSGGVHFEMQLANARRLREPSFRIIGIYREGGDNVSYLRDHRYIDFRDDSRYEKNLQMLSDSLWGRYRTSKPALAVDIATVGGRVVASLQEDPWMRGNSPTISVNALEITFGVGLLPLVDEEKGGKLIERIGKLRCRLAEELGMIMPMVRIRDDPNLESEMYRIHVNGNVITHGHVYRTRLLAQGRDVHSLLEGIWVRGEVFEQPSTWIKPALKEKATSLGFSIFRPEQVIVIHLKEVVKMYAHELLGTVETQILLDDLAKDEPSQVKGLVPEVISLSVVKAVLQGLLEEGVPIRELKTILEVLADQDNHDDLEACIAQVRIAIGRSICFSLMDWQRSSELKVLVLDESAVEFLELIGTYWRKEEKMPLTDEKLLDKFMRNIDEELEKSPARSIFLTTAETRYILRVVMWRERNVKIISEDEIPFDVGVSVISTVRFSPYLL